MTTPLVLKVNNYSWGRGRVVQRYLLICSALYGLQ